MKRLSILVAAALVIVLLAACKKKNSSFEYNIVATSYINTTSNKTTVNVTSSFSQDDVRFEPEGTALLVFSSTQSMSACETLKVENYPFNGTCTFILSNSQRPFDKKYWYFIELQAPFSEPLRSDVYVMSTSSSSDPSTAPAQSFYLKSSGSYIKFAPGNLQYRASSNTWRFADNQYDFIGSNNKNISSSYSSYIDLFGYGTSGYSYKPYSYEVNSSLYASAAIKNTKNDWGVYCNISNGQGYSWRLLDGDDWAYIYSGRPNASQKRSRATVNGIKGFILLPDEWTLPSSCSFTSNASTYGVNTYSSSQWQSMENAGAVFLPAAGIRVEKTVNGLDEGMASYYSSSWIKDSQYSGYRSQPVCFAFSDSGVYPYAVYSGTDVYSAYGCAVRLVRIVQSSSSKCPEQIPVEITPIDITFKEYGK